ncbi:hypothetical protein [Ruminococcus sp. NK3A76]|uniref:hypothetical protein n=1 Tax=Ruminococcus sp. NK3A76 TaxID=877411 RepID=UPI00048F10BE|nr:hypothetical protein [Ruminococcus sp. NK3A76]
MLIILPVSFEHESSGSVKQIARKLDGELIQKRPSANVMANSRFIKKYKTQSVFYGCRSGEDRFSVFYHEAGKRDTGSVGFYGKLTKNGKGTKISGHFRKPLSAYIFGAVWVVITFMFALIALSLDNTAAFIAGTVLLLLGVFVLFFDKGKKKVIRAFIESL